MFRIILKICPYLILFFYIFGMVACDDDDDSVKEKTLKIQAFQLEGEWVSDNWNESTWEIMKFLKDGEFYYANDETKDWNTSDDQVQGRYRIIGDDMVECSFFSEDISLSRNMILSEISDSTFTAKCYERELIGIQSYVNLLKSYKIEWKESIRPDYLQLLGENASVFKSLRPEIADVDPVTGEITAKFPGRTLIYVTTKNRTSVIEISVLDIWPDYIQYFGMSREEIKDVFGSPLWDNNMQTMFRIADDEFIKGIVFMVSSLTSKIDRVMLLLKEDCDKQMIVDYLKEKYYLDSDATDLDNDYYVFINKKTYRESTAMISYDGIGNSILFLYTNN